MLTQVGTSLANVPFIWEVHQTLVLVVALLHRRRHRIDPDIKMSLEAHRSQSRSPRRQTQLDTPTTTPHHHDDPNFGVAEEDSWRQRSLLMVNSEALARWCPQGTSLHVRHQGELVIITADDDHIRFVLTSQGVDFRVRLSSLFSRMRFTPANTQLESATTAGCTGWS